MTELERVWNGKTLAEVKTEVLDQVERLYLTIALRQARGKVGKAAQLAGIHPRGLYNKMKQYHLAKEMFKTASGDTPTK